MFDFHFSCKSDVCSPFMKTLHVNVIISCMKMHKDARDLPMLTRLIDITDQVARIETLRLWQILLLHKHLKLYKDFRFKGFLDSLVTGSAGEPCCSGALPPNPRDRLVLGALATPHTLFNPLPRSIL